MALGADSHDEVSPDDPAAHLAGDQEAEAPEHTSFGRIGQTPEQQPQPMSEGLVECHWRLRFRGSRIGRAGERGCGHGDQQAEHDRDGHPERQLRDHTDGNPSRECAHLGQPGWGRVVVGLPIAQDQASGTPSTSASSSRSTREQPSAFYGTRCTRPFGARLAVSKAFSRSTSTAVRIARRTLTSTPY